MANIYVICIISIILTIMALYLAFRDIGNILKNDNDFLMGIFLLMIVIIIINLVSN